VLLAHKDQLASEPVVLQELQEILVVQAHKALLDRLDRLDKQVVQAHREILAQLVLLDSRALQEQGQLVLQESLAQLVLQVLWDTKALQV
jgi:hypothetical protein